MSLLSFITLIPLLHLNIPHTLSPSEFSPLILWGLNWGGEHLDTRTNNKWAHIDLDPIVDQDPTAGVDVIDGSELIRDIFRRTHRLWVSKGLASGEAWAGIDVSYFLNATVKLCFPPVYCIFTGYSQNCVSLFSPLEFSTTLVLDISTFESPLNHWTIFSFLFLDCKSLLRKVL